MLGEVNHTDRLQPRADRNQLESQLEEIFIEKLEKYLSPLTSIVPQYEIQTIAGKYRLDFVIIKDHIKIGFECDGKDFHDAWRDEWRDGLILNTGEIDTIYRFRGKDIFYALDDCIYIIYKYNPEILNDRYQHFCERLTTNEILEHFSLGEPVFRKHEITTVSYDVRNDDGKLINQFNLRVERRNQNVQGLWQKLVRYVIANPNLTLDQVIKQYERGKEY